MKYRGRMDIVAKILEIAMNGAAKTTLMYRAYLSYAQIQEYVQFLTERKLMVLEAATNEYRVTQSGLRFLNAYDQIKDMVSLNTRGSRPSPTW